MRSPLLLRRLLPLFTSASIGVLAGCSDSESPDAGPADAAELDGGEQPCDPRQARVDVTSADGLLYTNGRFSPDGQDIALLAWEGLAFDDILIVDRCGENVRPLGIQASARAISTWSPAWSPDGTQVYFVGSEDSIRRVAATGGTSEIVVPSVGAPVLDLSYDGRLVLYGTQEFTLFDLETRTSTALGVFGTSPRLSPDGTKLAFTRERKVEILDLNTRQVREVVSFDSLVRLSVAWFSTGDRIAITSELGVEIVELTEPVTRRTIATDAIARDVDVSRDDDSVLHGLNGQRPLRVLRGFD